MSITTARLNIDVYVYGSDQASLNILQTQWKEIFTNSTLSKYIDISVHYQEDFQIEEATNEDADTVVMILYDKGSQEDLHSAWVSFNDWLHKLNSVNIYLVENTAKFKECATGAVEPPSDYEWPPSVQFTSICTNNTAAIVSTISELFNTAVFHPALRRLSSEDFEQLTHEACSAGDINVLRYCTCISGGCTTPQKCLEWTLHSLQKKSCADSEIVNKLLDTAQFVVKNSRQMMEYLHKQWSNTPRAVLLVLCRILYPYNALPQHLLLAKQNLRELPSLSIADTAFTHISLRGNNLSEVPEELFQLQSLKSLDLSVNHLEKLPSLLKWNTPKLCKLNVSYNELADVQKGIIRRNTEKRQSMLVSKETPYGPPQQKIVQLTEHNMYTCLHSLIDVDISHNPRLTQVPEWVCVLPHLVCLNLRGLPQLVELPKSLANFRDLTVIQLDTEGMVCPPADVCNQGSLAIVTYLRSLLRGTSNYRRMNLCILGNEKSGRSTLFRSLQGNKGEKLTDSVGIGTYDYRGETRDRYVHKVTYQVMDFSTEVINLSIYQCFLNPRGVYLCLWDATTGAKGLKSLANILRVIHCSIPNAQVLLIGTHLDNCPGIAPSDVEAWQKEAFGVDQPQGLYDPTYAGSHGLPRLQEPLLLDARNKEHVEILKSYIHLLAGDMRVSNSSHEMLIEEVIPRSCTLLQSHIESKIKQCTNVIKYSEFIDSFRSVSHQSGDVNDDYNEFDLACQFLHSSGSMYHYHLENETSNQNDLFFLNFQWLSDMLAILVSTCKNGSNYRAAIESTLASYGLQNYLYKPLVSIMIKHDLIVPINPDQSLFIQPLCLPFVPSYPPFNLLQDTTLSCSVSFQFLPDSLFSHLLARALPYLDQVGMQLIANGDPFDKGELSEEAIFTSHSKEFILGRNGYIKRSENYKETTPGPDIARESTRVLSLVEPINESIQVSLQSRIALLSKSFSQKLPQFSMSTGVKWDYTYSYCRCSIYNRGLHLEFLNGTLGWVEFSDNNITVAVDGEERCRKRVLTFLLCCLEYICKKNYVNLKKFVCFNCTKNEALPAAGSKCLSEEQLVVCSKCSQTQDINELISNVFLAGISIVDRKKLSFEANEESCLKEERFTKIYHGTYNDHSVAVKVYKDITSLDNILCLRNVQSEMSILSNISHPHILVPLGVSIDPLAIILPLSPFGSLEDHLELCPHGIDDKLSHILLYQIADGMKYLHSLNIIHSDIKPSNVMIWSLSQERNVSVKLIVSQQATRDEYYAAPELLNNKYKSSSYSEKVDIFSFGILLYNTVTGKRYIPKLYNKQGQMERRESKLSNIATAIEQDRPIDNKGTLASNVLQDGVHPAARGDHISMCISTCMQSLMEDCLAGDPERRPTSEGIVSRLLVCAGPTTQEKYILHHDGFHISRTALMSSGDIVGWENNETNSRIMLLAAGTFASRLLAPPINDCIRQLVVCKDMIFFTTANKRVCCASLPDYTGLIIAKGNLPAPPTGILISEDAKLLIVFMETSKVALYSDMSSNEGCNILNNAPVVCKPFDYPDKKRWAVTCGVINDDVIMCNGGRYLVKLSCHHSKLQQVFYKSVSEGGAILDGMTLDGKYLWVWFRDCGEVAICNAKSGDKIDTIEMKFLLEGNIRESRALAVHVTMVASTPKAMWVGTNTGHLFGFHHEMFQLLTSVCRHSMVTSVTNVPQSSVLLVFGEWSCGDNDTVGGYTVLYLYL